MMTIEGKGIIPTILTTALQNGLVEGQPDTGTFLVDYHFKNIYPLTCAQGQEVQAITVLLRQTDLPPGEKTKSGHLIAGLVDINRGKSTVLIDQESPGSSTESIAKRTLDKACLERDCAKNGCPFKEVNDKRRDQRLDAQQHAREKDQLRGRR